LVSCTKKNLATLIPTFVATEQMFGTLAAFFSRNRLQQSLHPSFFFLFQDLFKISNLAPDVQNQRNANLTHWQKGVR
jgi:hypothetical protein